jgi:hypothetical protein
MLVVTSSLDLLGGQANTALDSGARNCEGIGTVSEVETFLIVNQVEEIFRIRFHLQCVALGMQAISILAELYQLVSMTVEIDLLAGIFSFTVSISPKP